MEDPRIISALFIFLKMAYYNVLINKQRIALERIMESISGFSKRLFQWLSRQQKAVQQDRAFMSMTRMELLQRRMQNLLGR